DFRSCVRVRRFGVRVRSAAAAISDRCLRPPRHQARAVSRDLAAGERLMTVVARIPANPASLGVAQAPARSRDGVIDAMRGIAILMVIGIHSLPQPLDAIWAKSLDAALRPCVPVFLFASGYLTALSGH